MIATSETLIYIKDSDTDDIVPISAEKIDAVVEFPERSSSGRGSAYYVSILYRTDSGHAKARADDVPISEVQPFRKWIRKNGFGSCRVLYRGLYVRMAGRKGFPSFNSTLSELESMMFDYHLF